ncbi:guanylate kinase [Desulfococcus sp.]|uniref:guanylate kinase n=1 Tax=Desulfococcus sp. TaxID=2025834 RepID=UPI0035939827
MTSSTMETTDQRNGRLYIVSGPSGAGKTTLCRTVLEHFGDMGYSISHTTRAPRGKEKDGVDYFFIPKADFLRGISEGRWAEWAEVHNNFYGTARDLLEKRLARGRDVLLDIDVQGMDQIVRNYPESVTIFIMPPSLEALRTRMDERGTDTPVVIEKRLRNAVLEIAAKDRYQHVIVNDQLPEAVRRVIDIIAARRGNPPPDPSA